MLVIKERCTRRALDEGGINFELLNWVWHYASGLTAVQCSAFNAWFSQKTKCLQATRVRCIRSWWARIRTESHGLPSTNHVRDSLIESAMLTREILDVCAGSCFHISSTTLRRVFRSLSFSFYVWLLCDFLRRLKMHLGTGNHSSTKKWGLFDKLRTSF